MLKLILSPLRIPTDFLAISYVITTTSYIVTTLTFTDCSLDGEGVALFLEKMSSIHLDHIKYLGYHKQNTLVPQFETLNMLLSKLTSLETLDLQGTELGVLGVKRLTVGVELPNLTTLKLQVPLKNHTSRNAEVLKLLNCDSLQLEEIHYLCPKSKSYLECCEYVNALANAFGNLLFFSSRHQLISYVNFAFKAEPQSSKAYFQRCSKLVLIHCGINDDLLSTLVESMTICTELDTLHLDFNRITSKGATVLSNFLEKCIKLEAFSAHCNEIDDCGALAIANALVQLNNIKILDLQCNPITEEGASVLMMTAKDLSEDFQLYTTNSKLLLVQQSVNIICKYNSDINAIHSALKYSSLMQEVHISSSHEQIKNRITFECSISKLNTATAALLAEGMKCCTNLEALYLNYKSICSDGAVALAEGLKFCTNLKTLDLASNSIGSDGAVALAEGLKCCTNLQTLNLYSNSIGSDGAFNLAEGLKCCTNLEALNLSYNSIGSDSAADLAERLKCYTNLQTLNLSDNSIGSDGAVALHS